MNPPDILSAIKPLVEFLDEWGVPYYIGGSIASSAYGFPRATLDVDLVSNLKPAHVHPLLKKLESSYYIDEGMILKAIQNRSSFNLIHLATMLKVDVFIGKEGPYHAEAFKRRRKDVLDEGQETLEFYLASAEDVILSKLDWYRMGGGVSDRQWHDVMGILKVQGKVLDMEYLRRWAGELSLEKLLFQACRDAGME